MKKILLLTILAALPAFCQLSASPIVQVYQSEVSTVVAQSTTIACYFTNYTPAPPQGLHINCFKLIGGTPVFTADVVIAPNSINGIHGQLPDGPGFINWSFYNRPGSNLVSWEVATNGVAKVGTF